MTFKEMETRIRIPYGVNYKEAQIENERLLGCYSLNPARAVENLDDSIRKALGNPVGSDSLSQMIQGCRNILIVCDDNTRRTPVCRILPMLLDELSCGNIRDENIKILFAAGSHRPMTQEEMKEKLGDEIYRRIRAFNHDYKNDLVYRGSTRMGTQIYLNRLVDEADFVIGIGSIIPHRYCGWSGGGKIIQPGVCGEKTIADTHLLITKDPGIKLGSMRNKARMEINEVASKAGLKFIINTVLNSEGEVAGLVAGDPVSAHEAGMQIAQKVCGVKMSRADIVVIGSYPEELNIWQAGKALYAADLVVKDNGIIILVSPLTEGVGEHSEMSALIGDGCEKILNKLNRGEVSDLLSGAGAFALSQILDRAKVMIVTDGIDDETASGIRMIRYESLQKAVDDALEELPSAKVICLKEGTEILPVIQH